MGYFRILDIRVGHPVVLVAEPAERPKWSHELLIRADGLEQRRAFMSDCSWSLGERVQWPAERGQTPVTDPSSSSSAWRNSLGLRLRSARHSDHNEA